MSTVSRDSIHDTGAKKCHHGVVPKPTPLLPPFPDGQFHTTHLPDKVLFPDIFPGVLQIERTLFLCLEAGCSVEWGNEFFLLLIPWGDGISNAGNSSTMVGLWAATKVTNIH